MRVGRDKETNGLRGNVVVEKTFFSGLLFQATIVHDGFDRQSWPGEKGDCYRNQIFWGGKRRKEMRNENGKNQSRENNRWTR